MLVYRQNRVNCIVILQSVLNEPLPFLYIYSELVSDRESGFFETSGTEANVYLFFHEVFHIIRVY